MKHKIKLNGSLGNDGITLIEVIVSMALFVIMSLMLVSVMATSLAAIKSTRNRTSTATVAAGKIEADRAAGTPHGNSDKLTISVNGTTYDATGEYVTKNDGNITYKEFVPNP